MDNEIEFQKQSRIIIKKQMQETVFLVRQCQITSWQTNTENIPILGWEIAVILLTH